MTQHPPPAGEEQCIVEIKSKTHAGLVKENRSAHSSREKLVENKNKMLLR